MSKPKTKNKTAKKSPRAQKPRLSKNDLVAVPVHFRRAQADKLTSLARGEGLSRGAFIRALVIEAAIPSKLQDMGYGKHGVS